MAFDRIPTPADFAARRVTNPKSTEVIRQTLYDHQVYAAAGANQLSFFQSPIGQGNTSAVGATAATPKTQWDTNMTLGGQLSNGSEFLAESIEVTFYPGSVSTANTYTVDALTFFLAAASAVPTAQVDDVNIFYQSGMIELNILSKNYLRETPLMRCPPKCTLDVVGAISSNSATTAEVGFAAAHAQGRPMYLDPEISIQAMMAFEVVLKWPAVVATVSTFNARVGVILDGFMFRAGQ